MIFVVLGSACATAASPDVEAAGDTGTNDGETVESSDTTFRCPITAADASELTGVSMRDSETANYSYGCGFTDGSAALDEKYLNLSINFVTEGVTLDEVRLRYPSSTAGCSVDDEPRLGEGAFTARCSTVQVTTFRESESTLVEVTAMIGRLRQGVEPGLTAAIAEAIS